MLKTLQKQITERIAELDLKEEFDLRNAWESLEYLKNEYSDYLFFKGDKTVTFREWYEIQKQNWLWGSGVTTDVDYWVSDIEELNGTGVSDLDYELFDKYFQLLLDNK